MPIASCDNQGGGQRNPVSSPVNPPAGTLDSSFGSNGKITIAMSAFSNLGTAITMQPDGKVVIAGYVNNGRDNDFTLTRYNSDGSLDTAFGIEGSATTPIGNNNDIPLVVLVREDGKIVVAGSSDNGSDFDFAVARYTPDGAADDTFGTAGKVITPITADIDAAFDIAFQSDGKMIAAGGTKDETGYNSALVRYNDDGSLDATFGTNGKVIMADNSNSEVITAAAIQSDEKIIVVGTSLIGNTSNGPDFDIVMNRLNTEGSADTTFGINGRVTIDIADSFDEASSVLVQTDGKILVAGGTNGGGGGLLLARYDADGGFDSTFGTGGLLIDPNIPISLSNKAIRLQPDGKIVVAGISRNWPNSDGFIVGRYNSDGTPDITFGSNGKATITDVFSNDLSATPTTLSVQSDGKIAAAAILSKPGNNGFFLAHYDTDGNLDMSDGTGSKIVTAPGAASDYANAIVIQTDGKIVTVGGVSNGNNSDIVLTRLNSDGSLDITFGDQGKVITDFDIDEEGRAIVIQSDGKIVVVGQSFSSGVDSNFDFLTVRYNRDGSLDTTFGSGGKIITDLGANSEDIANALALQPDGKIIVAGGHPDMNSNQSPFSYAIVRYLPDGTLDLSFGAEGIVITPVGVGNSASISSLTLQSDGKILAAGDAYNENNSDFSMVRYNQDGSIDTTFRTGGIVITDFGDSDDTVGKVFIQQNGQIILSGRKGNGATYTIATARYNQDGSLDTTFGIGGKVLGNPDIDIIPVTAALQSDDKIILAGLSLGISPGFALTRLQENGAIDATFGKEGRVATKLSVYNDVALAVAIQPDGKIIAAGYSISVPDEHNFALARFWP